MTAKVRKTRFLEKRFLQVYSAWQETHRLELASRCMTLLGELLKVNPRYSAREPFQTAF